MISNSKSSKGHRTNHQQVTMGAIGKKSPLPAAALCLLCALLFDHIGIGSALRCYQGQQQTAMPIQGSPQECPMQSYTCIKSVDFSQGTTMRACQSTNCTVSGTYTVSSSAMCQNSSGYPTLQTFCCCYGDGCNSAMGTKSADFFLLLLVMGGVAFAAGILGGGGTSLMAFLH